MNTEDELFIRKALARVEKAEKLQRIRRIAFTVIAFGAAGWLASKEPSKELNVECVVIIFAGLIAAICTSKIMSLINANTRLVLQAITEMHAAEGQRK